MKIIRTPIDWNSIPDDNWLHSSSYTETADIKVDENYNPSRTGTVTFTQAEGGNQEEVTVVQKRVTTFYYPLGTNYRPSATFNIGGQSVASNSNGVAIRVCAPDEAAPEEVTATPETNISKLEVSQPSVTFPQSSGAVTEVFIWTNWDTTQVTLKRSATTEPQEYINSVSTNIPRVTSASGPDWLTVTRSGGISASTNTSTDQRTGTVEYQYSSGGSSGAATVRVTQEGKPPATTMYFGVKTESYLASGQQVTFTISGEDSTHTEDVNFSSTKIQGYYVAYVSASSESSVSASCNISDYSIWTDESKLTFNPTGETKIVHVHPQKVQLYLENQNLTGCSGPSNDGFYTINAETDENQSYSSTVSGDGFSISGNSITASTNNTDSGRSGTAEFTLTEVTGESETVELEQDHVNSFTFISNVSGSPTSGQVSFYEYGKSTAFTTVDYTQTETGQSVDIEFFKNFNKITYKVTGFEPEGSISASTNFVNFSPIKMVLSGDKYTLSNIEKTVGISALGVSYTYEKTDNGQSKSYPDGYQDYLSGTIEPNHVVTVNATATTENKFTISDTYEPTGTSANWSFFTDSVNYVTVRTKATIPVLSSRTLTLVYTLKNVPEVSAKTEFFLPESATSTIVLENFVLASETAFGNECKSPDVQTIPSGASAFTFAFWPPSRTAMAGVPASGLKDVNVAEMRYRRKSEGTPYGWMLFYPYTPNDGQMGNVKNDFANYTAKVYALSYNNVTQSMTGKNDSWTLGPLMYKSGATAPYYEVENFNFLSAGGQTNITVCNTQATTSTQTGVKPYYPSVCAFSPQLSASSNYFQVYDFQNGSYVPSASSRGYISDDKRTWTISGNAVGGIYNASSSNFISRTTKMINRNRNYHYNSTVVCNEDAAPSPDAMAHALLGTLVTNILGAIQVKVVYHGNISGFDNKGVACVMPADTYVVTPTTPGDTSSVVYDAETGMYLIYDINNVVVLTKADYTVVPRDDLSAFSASMEAEIIGPAEP